jgi:glycosyltransferase involved in cell wall biosynthesis
MNPTDARVTVVIPAFNESQTVGGIISTIKTLHPDFEVIVVDDGSTDDTASTARHAGAVVFSHPYNIGNGAAIKTGIRHASGQTLLFMDGDGQHDPSDIEMLLGYFPGYDMVVGARNWKQHGSWGRALGNRFYNRFASYVAKFRVEDLTSGFRAVKADIARRFLYLLPNTYSYPTTLTLGVLRNGRSVKYVPINIKKRKAGKSGISIFRDGVRFFMTITKLCTLYSPFRVFLPVSFFVFLVGLFYYGYTFISYGRFTNMSALLFTTSVLIFMLGLISEQISQVKYERSEDHRPF